MHSSSSTWSAVVGAALLAVIAGVVGLVGYFVAYVAAIAFLPEFIGGVWHIDLDFTASGGDVIADSLSSAWGVVAVITVLLFGRWRGPGSASRPPGAPVSWAGVNPAPTLEGSSASVGVKPVVVGRRPAARCAVCHAALTRSTVACFYCGTVLHSECLGEVCSCPTLGCAGSNPWVPSSGEPWLARWWTVLLGALSPLAVVGLMSSAILAGLVVCSFPGPPWEETLDQVQDRAEFIRVAREAIARETASRELQPGETVKLDADSLPRLLRYTSVVVSPESLSLGTGGGFGTWGLVVTENPHAPEHLEWASNSRQIEPHLYLWWSN